MRFYKKIGRLTQDEQAIIQQIEKLADEKGIPLKELTTCHNFDQLLMLLSELSQQQVAPETNSDTQPREPISDFKVSTKKEAELPVSQVSEENKTNSLAFDEQLMAEAINDNENTELVTPKEIMESEGQEVPHTIIEDGETKATELAVSEATNESKTSSLATELAASEVTNDSETGWLAEDYDPFSEEIIERSYNGTDVESENKAKESTDSIEDEPPLRESTNTPVDNLNPNTKRRAAEQTANALLKGYARLAPKPFKWLAKIDEEKIEKLSFDGQIDISIEVSEGMTFDDYMKQTNAQVDEIFEVEQETLDEIREPLVEVLMEQQMELTPQQRLAMAVFSHLIQMLTVALKLRKQNNRILAYQKKITHMGQRVVA